MKEKIYQYFQIVFEFTSKRKSVLLIFLVLYVIALILVSYFLSLNNAPEDFPTNQEIVISEGLSVKEIIQSLTDDNVVRSSFYFYVVLKRDFEESHILAGTYYFTTPLTTFEVAKAVTSGTHGAPLDKVTIPEGFRIENLHIYLPKQFANDDIRKYLIHEGYLFPDTYYISGDTTLNDLILIMQETFDKKITTLDDKIANSDLTKAEVIILASILEREAKDYESMQIVAGILEDRLNIGMALQVDATFEYLLGKASHELTEEDLSIDSPYNTYTNVGLPPTPISNPGLNALTAVLNPIKTDYLYYLTDDEGVFHYAVTFEEHKRNKARYLR